MFRKPKPRRYYGERPRRYRRKRMSCFLFLACVTLAWLLTSGSVRLAIIKSWREFAASRSLPIQATTVTNAATPTSQGQRLSTVAPTQTAPNQAVTAGGALCPAECGMLQDELLRLVNQDRQANGVGPLALYEPANQAAQNHAEDMILRGYFEHESPEGATPGDRLQQSRAGPAQTWGENIWMARGLPVDDWNVILAKAEDDWIHSPGHRANLLNANFHNLGIGISYSPTAQEIRMVQVFFTPQQ